MGNFNQRDKSHTHINICIFAVNVLAMNIFNFFREIGKYRTDKDSGLRGTTSGKLYVDKAVFYKRKEVQEAIQKLKDSPVIKQHLGI